MISNIVGDYFYSYNSNGELECVNHKISGATVWVRNSEAYTLENPLTAEFLATDPDLTDQPLFNINQPNHPP